VKLLEKITLLGALAALAYACRPDNNPAGPGPARRLAADASEADQPMYGPWSAPANLGPVVNSPYNDQHPAISKDGLSLYISSDRPGKNKEGLGMLDIWVAYRDSIGGPWRAPQHLGPNINSAGMDLAPNLTPDGHNMYFHSTGRGGCGDADLFVSHRDDNRFDSGPKGWQPAENLGCVVNSTFKDAGPTYFEDEVTSITTLYFTRQNNPPGSDQGWDIYATTRTGDEGVFGTPVLVPELSSPQRDTRTAIRRDGLEIFLSSGRPGNDTVGRSAGSEDLWVSRRATTTDSWSRPLNLNLVNQRLGGDSINEASFDGGPALSFDGTTLYFFSDRGGKGSSGKNDLYCTIRQRLHGRGHPAPSCGES